MVGERAFDTLFRNFYGELHAFARRFVVDDADCEDIVSDAFEDVWLRLGELQPDGVRAFLYTDVRNKCIDHLRRQQTRRQYVELMAHASAPYDQADRLVELHERERQVGEALESLPEQTRLIFTACYVDRKQYQEVARELGISPNTVKKHVSRALQLMAERREKAKNL